MSQDSTYEAVKHRYTEGDTGPPLICTYVDATGTAIDVTGYTITLRIDAPGGVVTKTATLSDPTNGVFQFGDPWGASDLVEGYAQVCEIELIDTGAVKITAPKFLLNVERRIA